MAFLDAVRDFFSIQPMQARAADPFVDAPDLAAQFAAIRAIPRPWRAPTIREAMGVPSIQRAVTLISNSVGSLTMQGWRNGVVMPESPDLLARPNPFETPRDAYRDMGYQLATRGETVSWIASRDSRGAVQALVIVPLAELNVEENPRNRLYPIYTWGNVKGTRWSPPNPQGDFVHITYLKEPGALRGIGPLQMAGAAVSVSVEAQEWAANYYAGGGAPSVNLHTEMELSDDEAAAAKAQWMNTPANMPKVTSGSWELRDVPFNEQGAQMLDAREYQNGDSARLFGIPGALMEYGAPGSSLTYQNLADVWINFVRGSLSLNYLEPIEQAMTDLMPRTTTARFNVQGLQRADEETRWRIYAAAVGVIGPDEAGAMARQREGLAPGDAELAPVPFAPPAAVPTSIPGNRSAGQVRCDGLHPRRKGERCNALLAEAPPFTGSCWRCGQGHTDAVPDDARLRRIEEAVASFRATPAAVVNFHEGAIQSNVTAPPVEITMPARDPQAVMHHHVGEDGMDTRAEYPSGVIVPAPVVHVEAPVVNVPPAVVNVDAAPFTEAIAELRAALTPRPTTRTVDRDERGLIVRIHEEIAEETA